MVPLENADMVRISIIYRNKKHVPIEISVHLFSMNMKMPEHLNTGTAQKMKFPVKGFFNRCDETRWITSTKETFNGNLHFLCSANSREKYIHLGLFRTLLNIYDGAFCENGERLKAISYFHEKLHQRSLAGP